MGRMPAEPYRAADTGPTPSPAPAAPFEPASGSLGKCGARWARTATGPTPGPPPPCGMQNVLCRFRWETSAPNLPGRAYPTSAFKLAPSTYTWPPASWTFSQSAAIDASYTPWVDG